MRSAWSRIRARLPLDELPVLVMVLFLTLVVAQSTVVMGWVQRGSDVFLVVGALAVLTMSVLATIRRLPSAVALALGLVLAFAYAWYRNAAALVASHPHDAYGIPMPNTWFPKIAGGDQVDLTLFLFLGCVAFWIVGGWLAWCTIRWRKPLLGLAPAIAVFATNILNSKDEQNANTLYFLILTIALLLWTSYRTSLVSAVRSGLRLSSDSRWDFWETGVAATAVVMLLAIFVPPLTHDDQTVNVENGAFRSWAQFEVSLNHQVQQGRRGSAVFSQGFSTDAGLNGSLRRSEQVVFTYTLGGQYFGARYFRGVDLQLGGRPNQWAYLNNPFGFQTFVGKNSNFPYSDSNLQELNSASIQVRMIRPPSGAPAALFYPGQLVKTDRDVNAVESYRVAQGPTFGTVDKVDSAKPPTSAGNYKVTVEYSNPTEEELRAAGVKYPTWLPPYLAYPGLTNAPKSISTLKIKELADTVTAPFANNYDRATGIEAFLRTNYTYKLKLEPLRDGATDPLDFFLYTTKTGYCEYFATAMGDMLRAEGIPARLVSGFGAGTFDSRSKSYVVRESDAHTWVEAYFPGYGWIPFEPTPDGTYFPIQRAIAPNSCTRDTCATGSDLTTDIAGGTAKARGVRDSTGDVPEQAGGINGRSRQPYWLLIPFGLLLLCLVALFAAGRYLRPRDADQVWRRLARISRMAGFHGPPGETPSEFGRRLAAALPEAARPIRELSDSFVVAAYAPPEKAMTRGRDVVERWEQIRPHLVRRLVRRVTPAW